MGDLADKSGVIDVGVRISVMLSHPILKWSISFLCVYLTPTISNNITNMNFKSFFPTAIHIVSNLLLPCANVRRSKIVMRELFLCGLGVILLYRCWLMAYSESFSSTGTGTERNGLPCNVLTFSHCSGNGTRTRTNETNSLPIHFCTFPLYNVL